MGIAATPYCRRYATRLSLCKHPAVSTFRVADRDTFVPPSTKNFHFLLLREDHSTAARDPWMYARAITP